MHLTGDFEQMMNLIFDSYPDYSDREYITFGILIVDPRQPDTKAQITNHLSHFDALSAGYFDFFIPGFRRDEISEHHYKIRGVDHYFDEELWYNFCDEFCKKFKIIHTYNPMLILMTMQKSDINTAEYIVLELDNYYRSNPNGIRRAACLFEKIFEIARETPDLYSIRGRLCQTYLKSHLLNIVISLFNQPWISELSTTGQELARYRIRVR